MDNQLQMRIRKLYREYGYSKRMGLPADNETMPHYFLHRQFLSDQDLLIIFNTKRCRYQCHFCNLPSKSRNKLIPTNSILAQFEYVANELKHSLSVINRITLSNEGSVLDTETFPHDALVTIAECTTELRNVRILVFETRMEFVTSEYICALKNANPRAQIDILTGFETVDSYIRDEILGKREPIESFLHGLDELAQTSTSLTAYVLFKPSPYMTDDDAKIEAEKSIDFLLQACNERQIPLIIRLNPMYAAENTVWAKRAFSYNGYLPPRLSDVLEVAECNRARGVQVYIGLSTEGLEDPHGTYRSRDDFSIELLKQAINLNKG